MAQALSAFSHPAQTVASTRLASRTSVSNQQGLADAPSKSKPACAILPAGLVLHKPPGHRLLSWCHRVSTEISILTSTTAMQSYGRFRYPSQTLYPRLVPSMLTSTTVPSYSGVYPKSQEFHARIHLQPRLLTNLVAGFSCISLHHSPTHWPPMRSGHLGRTNRINGLVKM